MDTSIYQLVTVMVLFATFAILGGGLYLIAKKSSR